jgi:long-chain acyl-CoA synthetase
LVLNRDALGAALTRQNLSSETVEGQDTALDLLKAEIDAYRQGGRYAGIFPERWLPAAIAVLGEGFTEQNRMLNSTLKVVRGRVVEAYRDRINFLYTPEGKDLHNSQNREVIGRL